MEGDCRSKLGQRWATVALVCAVCHCHQVPVFVKQIPDVFEGLKHTMVPSQELGGPTVHPPTIMRTLSNFPGL